MNMVIPNAGKAWLLDEILKVTSSRPTFTLDLFQSNTTVVDASVPADFTISTFPGYAQIAIARADWDAAVVVANQGKSVKTISPVFSCSSGGPQNVYGWILRVAGVSVILAGQNFDVPRVASAGWIETLNPFQILSQTLH